MILAVGFGLTAAPAKAQSTTFAVAKYLCPWTNAPAAPNPGPCLAAAAANNLTTEVIPGQPVFYLVTILGNANPWTLTLAEDYPPGFRGNVQDVRCVPAGSTTPVFTASDPLAPSLGPIPIAAGQTLHCTMAGYFTASTATATQASNTVDLAATRSDVVGAGVTGEGKAIVNATVLTTATLPTDLSITKTASTHSIPLGGEVTYTLTISNASAPTGSPVYLGGFLQLLDQLAILPGSMPLKATLLTTPAPSCTPSGGATCIDPVPYASASGQTVSQRSSISTDYWNVLARWRYASGNGGFLPPGGSMTLVYTLQIEGAPACAANPTGHGFMNFATFDLLGQPGATLGERNQNNNSTDTSDAAVNITTLVDPCNDGTNPVVTVSKLVRNPLNLTVWPWGSTVTYDVTVENRSGVALTNVSLLDLVQTNYVDTTMIANVTANPVCVPACGGTVAPPQDVSNRETTVWTSSPIASLADGDTITFPITIRYDMNSCAARPHSDWKIWNTIRVYFTTPSGQHFTQGSEDITMAPPPPCEFLVTKTFHGGPAPATLLFNTPYQYDVTFTNQAAVPVTIYTLRDSLRIDRPGYAVDMPLAYSYDCTGPIAFPTGYSPQSQGYPALASGFVLNTGNPVNGSQLIAVVGPLTFPPGATLTCTVNVVVQRPAPGDPNCMGTGAAGLQNTAMLFPSPAYNVNTGVPPMGGMWRSQSAPLPRCFNLTVNKAVDPPAALGTGPPLNYTITVTNKGDPISGLAAPNWLTVTDVFTGAYSAGAATVTVSNPAGSCNAGPDNCDLISGSGNPISLGIENLARDQVIALTFPLAPPFTTENVRNDVAVQTEGTLTTDWYARAPGQLNTLQQVPITTPVIGNALLKVCKVAGEGVEVGTRFEFTATAAGTGAPVTVTVPAGPAPGGYCQVVGRYPVDTRVVLAETVPPGDEVSAIGVEGAAATRDPVADPPGGRVELTLGAGVSEATFTNIGHGYVEICKAGEVTGMFHFTIDGRRYDVPAGACTPAIELRAGMHRLIEIEAPGAVMLACQIWPEDRESSCEPRERSMTFEVKAGGIATQTLVTIENGPTRRDREQPSGGAPTRH